MFKSAPLILALILTFDWATPGLSQDAAAGEAVFKKCAACHQVGPNAKHKTGPVLNGVVGRAAGTADGFRYRKHIVAAGEAGLIWDADALVEYLNDPTKYLKAYLDDSKARSGMTYKLRNADDARDVIAYIEQATLAASSAPAADSATASDTPSEPAVDPDVVIAAQTFSEEFLADEAQFEMGKEIWFAQCTHCHGFKAYPGKAPKLAPAKYTPEFVFKRVYKGFKKMPAWRDTYSVDEIRSIVVYVKSLGFSP